MSDHSQTVYTRPLHHYSHSLIFSLVCTNFFSGRIPTKMWRHDTNVDLSSVCSSSFSTRAFVLVFLSTSHFPCVSKSLVQTQELHFFGSMWKDSLIDVPYQAHTADRADITLLSMYRGHCVSHGTGVGPNTLWVTSPPVMSEEMPERWSKELLHTVLQIPGQTTTVIVEAPVCCRQKKKGKSSGW